MWKYDNKYIKFVWCCYAGLFCDILSLNVKMYLWLKLYIIPFFVSGLIYKISMGSNNYCSHCMYASSVVGWAEPTGKPVVCSSSLREGKYLGLPGDCDKIIGLLICELGFVTPLPLSLSPEEYLQTAGSSWLPWTVSRPAGDTSTEVTNAAQKHWSRSRPPCPHTHIGQLALNKGEVGHLETDDKSLSKSHRCMAAYSQLQVKRIKVIVAHYATITSPSPTYLISYAMRCSIANR